MTCGQLKTRLMLVGRKSFHQFGQVKFRIEDVEWNPLAIKHAGKMFYVRLKRIQSRSVWIVYAASQMLPASSARFLITLSLSHPDKEVEASSWSYTGQPSSLTVGFSQVVKDGRCLIMTDSAMEQLMNVNREQSSTEFSISIAVDIKSLNNN